jgi:hypothetical protein
MFSTAAFLAGIITVLAAGTIALRAQALAVRAQQSVRKLREYVRTWYRRYPVNCRIFVNVLYPNLFSGLRVCR